jgi:hypothetical protein
MSAVVEDILVAYYRQHGSMKAAAVAVAADTKRQRKLSFNKK